MIGRLTIVLTTLLLCSVHSTAQFGTSDYATVGGHKSGEIILGAFKAQQGVGGHHYTKGHHWESSLVDGFKIIVLRDSSMLFSYQNTGNKFDSLLITRFKVLKPGDRIIIHDIWATWYGLPKIFLQPLEYIIK